MTTTAPAPVGTTTGPPPKKARIESIDVLRGLVMVIMAIDHCRDQLHLGHPDPTDLATTAPLLFLTRWITHFCAPVFVFLSGISAYLAGTRRTSGQLSGFLIKRGLWLILVEVLVISPALTLDPLYSAIVLQVIWAIGGSMLLLGLLVRLGVSRVAIGVIGAVICFGHNILDYTGAGAVGKTFVWNLLVSAAGFTSGSIVQMWPGHVLVVAYSLLPWTGVMLVGYALGPIYGSAFNARQRRRLLLRAGLGLLAYFLVFRGLNGYGDPAPWSAQRNFVLSVLSFLNVTKYPSSLLYLCMTLGVALVVLAVVEGVRNRFTRWMVVYGHVPFFYYVIHWFVIAICHIVLFFLMGFGKGQIANPQMPFWFEPPEFGLPLIGVYGVWLVVVVALYRPCKWFGEYKRTHKAWWLSYV